MATGMFTGVPAQQADREGVVGDMGGGIPKGLKKAAAEIFRKAVKNGTKTGSSALGKSATSGAAKVGSVGVKNVTQDMVKKGAKKAAQKAAKAAVKGAFEGGAEAAAYYYMNRNNPQQMYATDRAATRAGLQMTSQRVRGTSSAAAAAKARAAAARRRKNGQAPLATRMSRLMRYMEQSRADRQRLLTQGHNYRYVRHRPFGMGAGQKKKKKKTTTKPKAGKKGKKKQTKKKRNSGGTQGARNMNVAASQRRWQELRDVFKAS